MKYFRPEEFACKCGCGAGFDQMNQAFLLRLDRAREISETPFVLTSAYRCAKHNQAVGGESTSSHMKGLAVDIKATSNRARFDIMTALWGVGFDRIGIGHDFIHVDDDGAKSRMVIWLYW